MKILETFFSQNTLYYPGCLTKFVAKDLLENYRKVLRWAGVGFIELADLEVCCGSPVLKAGYSEDFEDLAKRNLEVFREHGVGKIVTGCPACALVFKEEYPKVLGDAWKIKVEHILELFSSKLKVQNLKVQPQAEGLRVVYHDPCHLGRLQGVYDAPREIIKKLGYKLVELDFSREESFCCGGGGGVRNTNPKVAAEVGKERFAQLAKANPDLIVTSCPMCVRQLESVRDGLSGDVEIKDISELLVEKFQNDFAKI